MTKMIIFFKFMASLDTVLLADVLHSSVSQCNGSSPSPKVY